jgi:sRNA-binding protein
MYGQDHKEIIARLAYLFPKAFFEDPRKRVPLKSNIVADIEKQGCADLIGADVGAAVDFYMSHIGYQICLAIPGKTRVDLEGNPASKVTEHEAAIAQREAKEAGKRMNAARMAFNSDPMHHAIDRGTDLMSKVTIVREEAAANQKRANQSPADLLISATKKLARATTLLDSEDDEFKAMFLEKVLRETKADLDVVLARLR